MNESTFQVHFKYCLHWVDYSHGTVVDRVEICDGRFWESADFCPRCQAREFERSGKIALGGGRQRPKLVGDEPDLDHHFVEAVPANLVEHPFVRARGGNAWTRLDSVSLGAGLVTARVRNGRFVPVDFLVSAEDAGYSKLDAEYVDVACFAEGDRPKVQKPWRPKRKQLARNHEDYYVPWTEFQLLAALARAVGDNVDDHDLVPVRRSLELERAARRLVSANRPKRVRVADDQWRPSWAQLEAECADWRAGLPARVARENATAGRPDGYTSNWDSLVRNALLFHGVKPALEARPKSGPLEADAHDEAEYVEPVQPYQLEPAAAAKDDGSFVAGPHGVSPVRATGGPTNRRHQPRGYWPELLTVPFVPGPTTVAVLSRRVA